MVFMKKKVEEEQQYPELDKVIEQMKEAVKETKTEKVEENNLDVDNLVEIPYEERTKEEHALICEFLYDNDIRKYANAEIKQLKEELEIETAKYKEDEYTCYEGACVKNVVEPKPTSYYTITAVKRVVTQIVVGASIVREEITEKKVFLDISQIREVH